MPTKLTDDTIATIVGGYESNALDYVGDGSKISTNRAILLDYYNCRPFGDEVKGESQYVTSDVQDVVETMLPIILKTFTQSRNIGVFTANKASDEIEAMQKTEYANWVFGSEHDSTLILHTFFKDALLQYSGHVKVYWDESVDVKTDEYKGLSELEYMKLRMDDSIEEVEVETKVEPIQTANGIIEVKTYDVEVKRTNSNGRICVENIPPNEFLIGDSARDFTNPEFCGHRALKSRSDIKAMGFDAVLVDSLSASSQALSQVELSRDPSQSQFINYSSTDKSRDKIYIGEYYVYIDVDGDGISELWQIFYADKKILKKEKVDHHPFCSITPIPIPHRAIGNCPADLTADIQRLKSVLVRQLLGNIYHSNKPRTVSNDRVNKDHLLSVSAGSDIAVSGNADVQSALMPLTIPLQSADILQAIELVDRMREIRTGSLRDGQGLDSESLSKTATAFIGVRDSSQMRVELITRMFAVGVREIFMKIADVASKYQKTKQHIKVLGQPLEVTPSSWRSSIPCSVDVGIGAGDRTEKTNNLNFLLAQQKELIAAGSVLADEVKVYKSLEKLVTEIGLKDVTLYFNNPEVPEQTLKAENEILKKKVQEMQAQIEDPLSRAEKIRSETRLAEKQMELTYKSTLEGAKLDQADRHHDDELAAKLTKIEVDSDKGTPKNVPGSLV